MGTDNQYLINACNELVKKGYVKSLAAIAKECGKTSQYFTDLKKGKSLYSRDFLDLLLDKFPINQDYVINGNGPMLKEKTTVEEPGSKEPKVVYRGKPIHYYDLDASAGPIEMFDNGYEGDSVDLVLPGFSDCDIALNVWGDSMDPVLKSGEIVMCKKWRESFIEHGNIYLIVTKNNHRMIKYLQPGTTEEFWKCISANDFYSPFEIEKNSIHRLYIVKGHISRKAI